MKSIHGSVITPFFAFAILASAAGPRLALAEPDRAAQRARAVRLSMIVDPAAAHLLVDEVVRVPCVFRGIESGRPRPPKGLASLDMIGLADTMAATDRYYRAVVSPTVQRRIQEAITPDTPVVISARVRLMLGAQGNDEVWLEVESIDTREKTIRAAIAESNKPARPSQQSVTVQVAESAAPQQSLAPPPTTAPPPAMAPLQPSRSVPARADSRTKSFPEDDAVPPGEAASVEQGPSVGSAAISENRPPRARSPAKSRFAASSEDQVIWSAHPPAHDELIRPLGGRPHKRPLPPASRGLATGAARTDDSAPAPPASSAPEEPTDVGYQDPFTDDVEAPSPAKESAQRK
jgi:hypothetical protein